MAGEMSPDNRRVERPKLAQVSVAVAIEQVEISGLRAHPDNPRTHTESQIRKIANSILEFGYRFPVLIDEDSRVICGHGRVEACKLMGLKRVPAIRVTDLSDAQIRAQIRALMIADNRLTDLSVWDESLLAENLKILSDLELGFDIECIGFDFGDIEGRILSIESYEEVDDESEPMPAVINGPTVTRFGDLWQLGDPDRGHRVLCGDSTVGDTYAALLGDSQAAMVFTDPPYNLAARAIGEVCAAEHGDFEMAAGEMDPAEFTEFLGCVMQHLCRFSEPGSIHYLFMDWRHAHEILTAGKQHYTELKNLCVWTKDRAGMGTFYRSQHELVFVFKHGKARHRNHFELGQHGRLRSNVWCYPSARSMNESDGDPDDALKLHPTIKPVRLIQDAILDCSRRGEIVLDPFLGSGSTLIACERSGRRCVGIEIAPRYLDVAIRRWQQWTGQCAVHAGSRQTFDELEVTRTQERDNA